MESKGCEKIIINFKKIYKRISLYTHPDKTTNKFLNYLFIESKNSLENKNYFILILISSILGIKKLKLHKKEKDLLNKDIQKIINYRKQFIQNIVYLYDELSEQQRLQVVRNCIRNNCIDVKFKEEF